MRSERCTILLGYHGHWIHRQLECLTPCLDTCVRSKGTVNTNDFLGLKAIQIALTCAHYEKDTHRITDVVGHLSVLRQDGLAAGGVPSSRELRMWPSPTAVERSTGLIHMNKYIEKQQRRALPVRVYTIDIYDMLHKERGDICESVV